MLVESKDIVPHSYNKPFVNQSGELKFTSENPYESDVQTETGRRLRHGRSSSTFHKDFKRPEDFYACTGVFTKMKDYMRFDTSSNGGQILCPNCFKHVGQAKLSGIKCGCGFFQVPGYLLWKTKTVVKAR